MNGLDLFSGIGGLAVALRPWVRTVTYCEIERYAQGVLLSRMQSGDIDHAPIFDDVRNLSKRMLPEIDIIYGGFPCQDISCAGRGIGMEKGDRSGLFFEIVRLTEEIRPAFVFLENVPAIRTRGLSRVIRELSLLRYDLRWTVLSAAEVGAPHLRKRWFLLGADSDRIGSRDEYGRWRGSHWKDPAKFIDDGKEESLADASGERLERQLCKSRKLAKGNLLSQGQGSKQAGRFGGLGNDVGRNWWTIEPDVGRVANGVPKRVDRLKCLGNSVVPIQAREAFERLMGIQE